MRFTDATGQRWVRRLDGTLKPTVNYAKEQADERAESDPRNPGVREAMQRAHGAQRSLEKGCLAVAHLRVCARRCELAADG